ncbi:hypothetical protein B0H67DRAFT_497495 [Lasiosphaeris hirsuta]|uniref:NACHT domain-containing protein n=1 Tax=Lasiosphaeris hirsuta TaxID=260670 RepID=A0AA40DLW0_9PEZI|nr:hypothetical protein B0H67DRAFT_497495 [Lasiosphaeris hirsuta]
MYFLGTPHRGADLASLAKIFLLSSGHGTKTFLDDLVPGNHTINAINDDFKDACKDACLQVWSFYESVPTRFGLVDSFVVDKESAVLGFPGEHTQYINADHRHICKFDDRDSPNYKILQRALLTTVAEVEAETSIRRRGENMEELKLISSFLHVSQRPDALLWALNRKQQDGSCQWLTEDPTFQAWMDDAADGNVSPKIIWLNGRPGTGKSIAAGHVVKHLEERSLDCSFHFLSHNNKAGSTVSALLLSLASQMASSSSIIRREIISMIEDNVKLRHEDYGMIWSKLFADRILNIKTSKPQFWVIDAIDECCGDGMPEFVSLLLGLSSESFIRVFMTGRPDMRLERLISDNSTQISEIKAGKAGTLQDIEIFLRAKCPRTTDIDSFQAILDTALSKSNGIFLWAALTVARMEKAHNLEDMQAVLEETPSEMDAFYSRIITSLASLPPASYETTKCILKWTICSTKPLTIGELREAVKLDVGKTLVASAYQLESMVGNLILVDSDSRVHIMHETASAFLTKRRDNFWVNPLEAHSRLAEICLDILCGDEFAPPSGITRLGHTTKVNGTKTQLSSYASANFSYHLSQGSSVSDKPITLLVRFLRTNVLTWVEGIAMDGDLAVLGFAARQLSVYARRVARDQPDLGGKLADTVFAWVTDIRHIIAVFHPALVTSPQSIHFMIPHLCPSNSFTRACFAKSKRRLRVTGLLEDSWSDRLTTYLFPENAYAKSIASSDQFLAFGLDNGDIEIHHNSSSGKFDFIGRLKHGRGVRHLAFNQSSTLLASYSFPTLMLWEIRRLNNGISCSCLWTKGIDFSPSHVMFSPDGSSLTLADPEKTTIVVVRAADGQGEDPIILVNEVDRARMWASSSSVRVLLDPGQKLAAVAHRNASVALWDLEAVEFIGYFEKEGSEGVRISPETRDMVFNPVPKLNLLAISYGDGNLVVCDPWTLDQKGKYELGLGVLIDVLAATSDGRILAGGDGYGRIHLFLFESLTRIHQIERPYESLRIHSIAFATDNLRFVDSRGSYCNVWEPLVLLPGEALDEGSAEQYAVVQKPLEEIGGLKWSEDISTLIQTTDEAYVFAGRKDRRGLGIVEVYEVSAGISIAKLPLDGPYHDFRYLAWNDEKSLLLVVGYHCCTVAHISFSKTGAKLSATGILCLKEPGLRQAFISPDGSSLFVRTESAVKLIRIHNGKAIEEDTDVSQSSWVSHATDTSLMALEGGHVHLFDWATLQLLAPSGIPIHMPNDIVTTGKERWIACSGSDYLVLATAEPRSRVDYLISIDGSEITAEAEQIVPQTRDVASLEIQNVVGVFGSRLFFLNSTRWLCSISLEKLETADHYTRHFFIPATWHWGHDAVVRVISDTAVAYASGEELIILHGFLDFQERVAIEGVQGRSLRSVG